MQRRKKRVISIFFIIVFVVSLFYFIEDLSEYYKVKKEYEEIKSEVLGKDRVIHWESLWKINKDIVAWIEIPNTPVDYPVVQTKSNSQYLKEDIRGSYSIYGSIFLDERLYAGDLGSNFNNIIYGHNMGRLTDVMFGSLKEYLSSDYLKGHKVVNLYTPQKNYKYQIASVEYATAYSSVYYIDFEKEDFAVWVKEQVSKSLYRCLNPEIIRSYADRFSKGNLGKIITKYGNTLTLSTCDTTHNDRNKIVLFCIPK
ncbi:MAG: class B sortase [Eubacterium sp.]